METEDGFKKNQNLLVVLVSLEMKININLF